MKELLQQLRALLVVLFFSTSLIVLILMVPTIVGTQANDVLQGRSSQQSGIFAILPTSAVHAKLPWIDNSKRPLDLQELDCLIYLGQVDKIAVIYDVEDSASDNRVIRLPINDVVISAIDRDKSCSGLAD